MDEAEIKAKVAEIMRRESRFSEEAYAFIASAVSFTVGRLPAHRHVSAFELLGGVHDYAREEFGVLAGEVLHEWGIRSASDVGRIVYLLIDSGLLSASKDDAPEDFNIDFALADPPAAVEPPPPLLPPKID